MPVDYQALIAYAKSTKRIGEMTDATCMGSATNASCGDACKMWVRVENGKIVDISFEATGCVISKAASMILADQVRDHVEEVLKMNGADVRKLLDAEISPLRERCLTTGLKALQNAISQL